MASSGEQNTTSVAAMTGLAPSQTIHGSTQEGSNNNNKKGGPNSGSSNKPKWQKRNRGGAAGGGKRKPQGPNKDGNGATGENDGAMPGRGGNGNRNPNLPGRGRGKYYKGRRKGPPGQGTALSAQDAPNSDSKLPAQEDKKESLIAADDKKDDGQQCEPVQDDNDNPKKRRQNNKKKKSWAKQREKKRYPWRQHIPEESVDPITLDPLHTLLYPPFALVAAEPYEPVEVWPIPEANEDESKRAVVEDEEERQRRVIEEQWGDLKIAATGAATGAATTKKTEVSQQKRHYHLYDGRALAYYMVSQLQFIDPLNRRDLTRDELVNLDHYLRRHGFGDLNVTEAYDAKGVTISSASATGNTAAGRAAILQQEARGLLNALFGGNSASPLTGDSRMAPRELRSRHEARDQNQARNNTLNQRRGSRESPPREDTGVYGDTEGVLVIDDDINPGLRGNALEFIPASQREDNGHGGPNTLWSGGHIAARYGHMAETRDHDFPSLAATTSAPASAEESKEEKAPKKPPPKAQTLSVIGSAVKKTDPNELQRQWEAREEARKRAMMSNLTYGSNPASWESSMLANPNYSSGKAPTTGGPTEAQLERNRAFAEALGVMPATARNPLTSGWARPADGAIQVDEFGNELNAALYPDSLILQARERMGPLQKLEKKLRNFLEDDTSASLPLNPMDRPLRAFVHEYSKYWKLHTESFDPEPKRYIHCVKMRDTSAPCPLLSEAARNWRGPMVKIGSMVGSDHALQQTAGQSTRGREMPPPPRRAPLPLKPRSGAVVTEISAAPSPGVTMSGAVLRTMTGSDEPANSRFGALAAERERPKLELAKRTLPLELPPYEPPEKGFDAAEQLQRQKERMEEAARKEREAEEQKRRALEAAFTSDDESGGGYESSDWEEAEEMFPGSDSEDEAS